MWLLASFACDAPPAHVTFPELDVVGIPGHDDCLPDGEQMTEAVCEAVVAHDGRLPGVSFDKSGLPQRDGDPRLEDPDFLWLTEQIQRCTCACCHMGTIGGPGAYFWDLDFEPVWVDSGSSWSLRMLAGFIESETQVLPVEDLARVQDIVQRELDRRDAR